jgi:hypothetical protein
MKRKKAITIGEGDNKFLVPDYQVGDIVEDYSPQNNGEGIVIKRKPRSIVVRYPQEDLIYELYSEDVASMVLVKHLNKEKMKKYLLKIKKERKEEY